MPSDRFLALLDRRRAEVTAIAEGLGGGEVAERLAPSINRSLRLPSDQFVPSTERKDLAVLHHTAGGSARSTFEWWRSNSERIGTAFVVERDGAVFEVFPPESWAYHLGVKGRDGSPAIDRRSVGIEIASEGGLVRDPARSGVHLHAFGVIAPRTEYQGEVYDHGTEWRGFRWFAAYSPAAVDAAALLVRHLVERFGIESKTPSDHLSYREELRRFRGVLGHHHVRPEKSDLHPGFPWSRFVEAAGISLV